MRFDRAFTLIELAIVIVIIAFIAGGILAGETLIKQANLRSVLTEYDFYVKAAQEFQDKYEDLPGTFKTATDIWGTVGGGCPGTYSTTVPLTTNTCNGDGDALHKIGSCSVSMSGSYITTACDLTTVDNVNESFLAWQHLSNAGLIEGRYLGMGESTLTYDNVVAVIGVNVPASKYKPNGWSLAYLDNSSDVSGGLKGGTYKNVLMYGDDEAFGVHSGNLAGGIASSYSRGPEGFLTVQPVLPATEAMEIDKKADDGRPNTGKIRAWQNGFGWGTIYEGNEQMAWPNGVDAANNAYGADTVNGKPCPGRFCVCSLVFITGF